jgi:hypothetical protein
MLSLVDNTKRNLVILERQVNDYYIDNILTSLQETLMEKQLKAYQIISTAHEHQIAFGGRDEIESGVELVKKEYYDNIDLVRKFDEKNFEDKLAKNTEVYKEEVSKRDEIIEEKESKIAELDAEFVKQTNEIETQRKN